MASPFPGLKATERLGLAAIGLALALMAIRLATTLFTPEPTQVLTSGAEFESLYVVWKVVHGLPAYADQTRIPFAGTYYNWAYYALYGGIAKAAIALFGLSDFWIPLICKLVTITGVATGLGLCLSLGRRLVGPLPRGLDLTVASLWLLVFLGPLMGFWAMSTAPDIWALTLDAASVLGFIALYDRSPRRAVLLFIALAYLAWSFKQVFVYSMGGVGLYLLLRRDWLGAALLALGMPALWAATLGLGSPDFARMVFFGGSQIQLVPAQFLRNAANFAVKSAPLILGALAVAALLLRQGWREVLERPVLAVPLLGGLVAAVLAGTASAKLGAAENYFFTLSFHLALFLAAGLAAMARAGTVTRPVRAALALGWLLTGLALTAPFLGISGTPTVRQMHHAQVSTARCIGPQPGPVYVASAALALPWLVPSDPAFVLHWNYPLDHKAGVVMEGGGVEGLVASGYFATLVLNQGEDAVFGTPIGLRYTAGKICNGMVIHHRKEG
ncbi:hypothetical protein A6A04_03365 [Paramagnetospirillum marisnigri]|uniref:Glycosyltransferase RgtA/B/C/D-like domain-containing protein n=1 Tax=Paramagnetospirillum marisnigri TaxID=1285242 RepID=A0A178MKG5_9PROT|nr:hypothetical protein [Paramagnetospirillum marisnigri]OAN49166.1 hypothetical protein A6A04_03365 [Paramagnetospirillum marisnigri]